MSSELRSGGILRILIFTILSGGWHAWAAVSRLISCLIFYLNFVVWHSMLPVYISIFTFAGAGLQGQSSPNFYGVFLHQVNCNIDFYFYMRICKVWLARAAVSCFCLLCHLFPQVVIWPVRQHVGFILNHLHLRGLTCKGSSSPLTRFSIFELFQFVLTYLRYCYYLFMEKRTLLARAAVPFPSLFSSFFSAAFSLGGASIISVILIFKLQFKKHCSLLLS